MTEGEHTSIEEDRAFERYCRTKECTFIGIMEFLRKPNTLRLRTEFLQDDIPGDLKEAVTTQCKLEGLI